MAILDFIKNRTQSQQTPQKPQEQKPETAKQMYARQAAEEKAKAKPVAEIPASDKAVAKDVAARIEKATQHLDKNAPAQPAAPIDSSATPAPARQNMTGQDKAQESLSPTDANAGKTQSQEKQPRQEKSAAPEKPTIARRPPSWER